LRELKVKMVFQLLRTRSAPASPKTEAKKETQGTTQAIMNLGVNRIPRTASNVSSAWRNARRSINGRQSSRGSCSRRSKRSSKSRGTNSLFRAVSSENWELVISICEAKPYKAESWHSAPGFFDAHRSSNILPLHQACVFHPPKQVLQQMIQAYPSATKQKESGYGRLPLHIACHSSASLEAIQVLLNQRPSAAYEQDAIGRVPLHYALSNGSTIELVQELLRAASEAGGEQGVLSATDSADFNGWLPIHVACHMNSSLEVLRALRDANPDGVEKSTKKGSTPLTLLRGLTLPEQRHMAMEAVLLGKEEVPPKPADLSKLADIGNETVQESGGLSLDLNRSDASSLSSIDDTATVQTGTTKNTAKEQNRNNPVSSEISLKSSTKPKLIKKRDKQSLQASLSLKSASSAYLPTHSAYAEVREEENSHKLLKSVPSDSYALGAGHAVVRGEGRSLSTLRRGSIQLRGSSSSSSQSGDVDRRKSSRRRRRKSESREAREDDNAEPLDFQPVPPTAVYC